MEDPKSQIRSHLNLVQENYKVIWWKLFNCSDAKKWSNVLSFTELHFCLPMANGRLERIFSTLKFIKSDRRNCLNEHTLDRLIRINVEAPTQSKWNPETAVKLWSNDKIGRVTQKGRRKPQHKKYPQHSSTKSDGESETESISLDEWLQWISGTDSIIEENKPSEVTDLQEETVSSDILRTQSESDVIVL